ncbi:MAG: peroxidase-related enzyme [Acidobacteriia bacterium]|nr:peroxidase-related enzyme [Terriglobia bacterium]
MEAHGEDLRAESGDAKLAEHVKHNYLRAKLSPRQKALAKFAELVTRHPAAVRKQDVETLRKHGLSDRDILDAVEVIAYFNYINRVADALGTDPEPEMLPALGRRRKK